jgi:hypothetical protein
MSDDKKNGSLIIAYLPASNGGLSFRGTEVNVYDVAHYAEILLGHTSIICLHKSAVNEPVVLKKFRKRFKTFVTFESTQDLEQQLVSLRVDALYTIRSGLPEQPMLERIPMLVHAVYDMSQPSRETCARCWGSRRPLSYTAATGEVIRSIFPS